MCTFCTDVPVEELRVLKIVAQRLGKHVNNILKAVEDLDKRYLNHWIKTLNLEELAKELML